MKKVIVGAVLFFMLFTSWKPGKSIGSGHQVILIHLIRGADQPAEAALAQMKKENKGAGVLFYSYNWNHIEDLNSFLSANQLALKAFAGRTGFSFSAKEGNVNFKTSKNEATIIIRDQTVYYFFDEPLESQETRIKEILGLRSAILI